MMIQISDIWNFIKNPIVLMFLFLFGFIQMIVILAALTSNSNVGNVSQSNHKSQQTTVKIDWRFKTAIKVESFNENRTEKRPDDLPETIQYGSEDYQYPLLVDMPDLVRRVKANETVTVAPINEDNFTYIIENEHLCSGSKVDLLMLIKTAPGNHIARDAIRSTWGKTDCWGGRSVRRVFLLGAVATNGSQEHIEQEHVVHGDVVQASFLDHYYNNTYKMMLGLRWATSRCGHAHNLMFVDDDYMVQPKMALSYLESLSPSLAARLVAGYVWRTATPQRNTRTKWFVSGADYPWPFYPPYCSAGNFFLSMPVAQDLAVAMRYTRFLRFDDVFLGIVLHKLLLVPMHLGSVFSFNPISRSAGAAYRQMISSHGYKQPGQILDSWVDLGCADFCRQ